MPLPAGRYVHDAAWTIIEADEAAQTLLQQPLVGLGSSGAAAAGLLPWEGAPPPQQFPWSSCRAIRLGDGTVRTFLLHYTWRDGLVDVSVEPIEWSLGFLDQLAQSGVGLTDDRGTLVHANEALSRMLGVGRQALAGVSLVTLAEIFGLDRAAFEMPIEQALRGQPGAAVLHLSRADDGLPTVLDACVAPWRYHGIVCGTIWFVTDRSDIDQDRDHAIAVSSLHVAATLEHELRNPLQTIQAAAALIRPGLDGARLHALDVLEQQIRLTERILSAHLRPPQPAALTTGLVSSVVAAEIDHSALRLATQNLRFDHHHPRNEPLVRLDAASLTQVFANLFRNSAKARPDATVRIRYARRGDVLECRITDDGPGFPKALVGVEPLELLAGDPLQHLGLKIVSTLVHAHGGAVALSNAAHGGARVVIRLPVVQASAARPPSRSQAQRPTGPREPASAPVCGAV